MNLSGFQLDAINDLEMLRSLACDQTLDEHYHPQQQSPHHHNRPGAQRTSSNDMHTFSESIDELLNSSGGANANGDDLNSFINALQQSTTSVIHAQRKLSMMAAAHSSAPSPHSAYKAAVTTPHQTSHTDYFEEDMLTPLISPAMTPSFSYQQQQQQQPSARTSRQSAAASSLAATDYDFSPLSSPAIMPQYDQQNHSRHLSTESTLSGQQVQQLTQHDPFENLTPSEIYEKYEQLERAKLMITHRLSELQRQQELSGSAQRSGGGVGDPEKHHRQLNTHLHNSNYVSSPLAAPSQQSNSYTVQESNLSRHVAIPVSPVQSPQLEPVTPASLMKIKSSNSTGSNRVGENKRKTSEESSTTQQANEAVSNAQNIRRRASSLRSLSSKSSKEPQAKKMRRESHQDTKSNSNGMHASPRALKPLLISPTIRPGPGLPVPPHSLDDAERILATKSNYQNLMEGKAAALGIAFSPNIKSGLEIRRTAHKAAEQKRRDSLKEWFDRLRREVEEGYVKKQKIAVQDDEDQQQQHTSPSNSSENSKKNNNSNNNPSLSDKKTAEEEESGGNSNSTAAASATATSGASNIRPLSKVLLLKYAYEYISMLKEMVDEKDKRIQELETAQQQQDMKPESRTE